MKNNIGNGHCLSAVAAKLIMAEIAKSDWEEVFIAAFYKILRTDYSPSLPQQYEQVSLLGVSHSEKDIVEIEQQIIEQTMHLLDTRLPKMGVSRSVINSYSIPSLSGRL